MTAGRFLSSCRTWIGEGPRPASWVGSSAGTASSPLCPRQEVLGRLLGEHSASESVAVPLRGFRPKWSTRRLAHMSPMIPQAGPTHRHWVIANCRRQRSGLPSFGRETSVRRLPLKFEPAACSSRSRHRPNERLTERTDGGSGDWGSRVRLLVGADAFFGAPVGAFSTAQLPPPAAPSPLLADNGPEPERRAPKAEGPRVGRPPTIPASRQKSHRPDPYGRPPYTANGGLVAPSPPPWHTSASAISFHLKAVPPPLRS